MRRRPAEPPQTLPPPGVCVVAREEACDDAGRRLAALGERRVVRCERPEQLAGAVGELLPGAASVTFVVPGWLAGRHDPAWIGAAVRAMRGDPLAAGASWGIVTAPAAGALNALAERIVRGRGGDDGATERAVDALFAPDLRGRSDPWPPRAGDGAASLVSIDGDDVASGGGTDVLLGRRFGLLVVTGHGRSYCGAAGFACGARRPDEAPDVQAATCVGGLDCADPAFARLDPRRLRAEVLVLDTCSGAATSPAAWAGDTPPVGYLALCGPALAVVASDVVTQAAGLEGRPVLTAFAGASTLGEAVARLNRRCAVGNPPMPYVLLGDAEAPLDPPPWAAAGVLARTDHGWRVGAPDGAALVRVAIPAGLAGPIAGIDAGPSRLDVAVEADVDGTTAWLAARPAARALELRCVPDDALPPGLLEAARAAPLRVLGWRPPIDAAAADLVAAARIVLAVEHLQRGAERGRDSGAAAPVADRAVGVWLDAHERCVAALSERDGHGLWPAQLWHAGRGAWRATRAACPTCGVAPTFERPYRTLDGEDRVGWECEDCDLICDGPADRDPLELELDRDETAGEGLRAVVRLPATRHAALGAGTVVVDRSGHGLRASPERFRLRSAAGEAASASTELRQDRPAGAAHRYRVRAIVLADARWSFASRPLTVAR
jgi:hypothetical protein